MTNTQTDLNPKHCQKARLSRDARFDGLFFTAVKTTGIYCRSICPASPPKETNVRYYRTAVEAANAGFRPCLRCRPDSAPHSAAWIGNQALFKRAIRLIDQGALETQSLAEFSAYLGVSDRYLRQLFTKHIGIAPKPYALYQQCMFAKQLIHQTSLPINQIALASGFNSVRRFNDCFINLIKVTPSEIRRKSVEPHSQKLLLKLFYRPPYDWQSMQQFLATRMIPGLENVTADSYGRSFKMGGQPAYFDARHLPHEQAFEINIQSSNLNNLKQTINNIRRILDLDADTQIIESHLVKALPNDFKLKTGLRLPGIWSVFEAGIRAILGQQVSVQAAKNMLIKVIDELGTNENDLLYFPTPEAIIKSDLSFLKMPAARKSCLKNLAEYVMKHPNNVDLDQWLSLKGIGPWTVNYSKMRGLNDPDVFLAGDSGINKALSRFNQNSDEFNADLAAPWRSYLTFQLWSQL
ncbi:MAG: DNA-3-methyladenine glycosylase 2 family protein [Marinicella sp.]